MFCTLQPTRPGLEMFFPALIFFFKAENNDQICPCQQPAIRLPWAFPTQRCIWYVGLFPLVCRLLPSTREDWLLVTSRCLFTGFSFSLCCAATQFYLHFSPVVQRVLPDPLLLSANKKLWNHQTMLPGPSVLVQQVVRGQILIGWTCWTRRDTINWCQLSTMLATTLLVSIMNMDDDGFFSLQMFDTETAEFCLMLSGPPHSPILLFHWSVPSMDAL